MERLAIFQQMQNILKKKSSLILELELELHTMLTTSHTLFLYM